MAQPMDKLHDEVGKTASTCPTSFRCPSHSVWQPRSLGRGMLMPLATALSVRAICSNVFPRRSLTQWTLPDSGSTPRSAASRSSSAAIPSIGQRHAHPLRLDGIRRHRQWRVPAAPRPTNAGQRAQPVHDQIEYGSEDARARELELPPIHFLFGPQTAWARNACSRISASADVSVFLGGKTPVCPFCGLVSCCNGRQFDNQLLPQDSGCIGLEQRLRGAQMIAP
jgi:hypothetical protein